MDEKEDWTSMKADCLQTGNRWKTGRAVLAVSLIVGTLFFSAPLRAVAGAVLATAKTAGIDEGTPAPTRFVVRGHQILDLSKGGAPVFFRGIGYSPYLPGETPLYGASPGNDGRYPGHLETIEGLGANYIHVFPLKMPENFFAALDKTDLVYGQDIWIWPYAEDFLDETFQQTTMANIRDVIDHTYAAGRPDRLVLFSIGDELQAESVKRTDALHPETRHFYGRHVTVTNRTPTEVALAKLIDEAMDYELKKYGRRHLYCHTSWTHIGPVADRPDLELPAENLILPDMGDIVCMNIYTYANGVRTSPPGSVTGTSYQGYLEDLAMQLEKPIVITQVGLSTSPIEPKPWVPGFGGHSVGDVPETFRSVWRDVLTARGKEKYSGLVFFEFHDEWWKSGEDPTDSTRHEPEDPEEWFGLYEVGEGNSLVPKGKIPETVRELFLKKQ